MKQDTKFTKTVHQLRQKYLQARENREIRNRQKKMMSESCKIRDSRGNIVFRVFAYTLTIVWIIGLLFPLYWLLVSATKNPIEAMKNPPTFYPILPREYVIEMDTTGLEGYSDEDFLLDSSILLWMVADRNLNVNAYSFITVRVENGVILSKAKLKMGSFKKNKYDKLFAGSVSEETILHWAENVPEKYEKLTQVIKDDGFVTGLNEQYKKKKTGTEADLVLNFFRTTMDENNTDLVDYEKITTVEGKIVEVSYTKNFWGIFQTFSNAWNMFENNGYSFSNFLGNSTVIAFAAILCQWLFSAMAGYALSKLVSKKWSKILMIFIVATIMIPGIVNIIPLYTMLKQFNMTDNLLAVILPGIPNAIAIFLFKGFFDEIPKEIQEAGTVDGASNLFIYFKLIIPISLPVFGVIAILVFTGAWNDFFWPNMVLESEKNWTFPIVIQRYMNYNSGGRVDYSLSLAMSVIATIPTFILFLFFQKQMTKGLVFGGIKG